MHSLCTREQVSCTLSPRVQTNAIQSLASFFTVQSVVASSFNASIPFVVTLLPPANATNATLANFTYGVPVLVCANVSLPNITSTLLINTTLLPPNHNFSLPYNYTFYTLNTTNNFYNVTVCTPLISTYQAVETVYPVDNSSVVSALSAFSGTTFTFTFRAFSPGLRYLAVGSGTTTNVYNRVSSLALQMRSREWEEAVIA